MRVAIDTNRLTDLFQGDAELGSWLGTCKEIWIPLFVIGEIRAGFYGGPQRGRNEALLQRFLAKSTVDLLFPGIETAEHYGRLFAQLKRAGTPIPNNNLWIAALVLEHNLRLVTRDRHFEHIPQLLRD